MSKELALEKYSRAVEQVKAHQELNKDIFDMHKKLFLNVVDAENELRDEVAEAKAGITDGKYQATYTPQTQTFADIEVIDGYVSSGHITPQMRELIVKTVERPGRITVSEVKVAKI